MIDKQPMVMIHGWCGSPEHFQEQKKFFSPHYEVVVPDWYVLFEKKLTDQSNRIEQVSAFLAQYLKKNNINHPILMGHSMGGAIALDMVCRLHYPAQALVLIDTSVTASQEKMTRYRDVVKTLLQDIDNKSVFYDFFMKSFVSSFDDPEKMRVIAEASAHRISWLWLNLLRDATYLDFKKYLTICSIPFLFIGSSKPFSDFKTIQLLNPKALTAQVVASGHFVLQNVPEQINAMLDRYVRLFMPKTPSLYNRADG